MTKLASQAVLNGMLLTLLCDSPNVSRRFALGGRKRLLCRRKSDVLRPGIVDMRRSMVIRLRPYIISSTSPHPPIPLKKGVLRDGVDVDLCAGLEELAVIFLSIVWRCFFWGSRGARKFAPEKIAPSQVRVSLLGVRCKCLGGGGGRGGRHVKIR